MEYKEELIGGSGWISATPSSTLSFSDMLGVCSKKGKKIIYD